MRSANDVNGKKISIDDADFGKEYFCPTCKKKLFIKRGGRKKIHFSHYPNESCIDYWKYDESDWSDNWKRSFSLEETEIVHNDHHIDIEVKNNLGIMFSSESIRRDSFVEKTDFMLANINNAMWLFNLTELYEKGIIEPKRTFIHWRNMWKTFCDYAYTGRKVWIAVEISVNGIRWFGILKDIERSFIDKKLYILRWMKYEQFRRYFNDIADKKDPEIPYIEKERELQEQREKEAERKKAEEEIRRQAEAEEERIRIEIENKRIEEERQRLLRYEELLKQQREEKERELLAQQKKKEEDEKRKLEAKKRREEEIQKQYDSDPEMRQMSEQLSRLSRSNDYKAFADLAEKWNKKYGFVWLRSQFYH